MCLQLHVLPITDFKETKNIHNRHKVRANRPLQQVKHRTSKTEPATKTVPNWRPAKETGTLRWLCHEDGIFQGKGID